MKPWHFFPCKCLSSNKKPFNGEPAVLVFKKIEFDSHKCGPAVFFSKKNEFSSHTKSERGIKSVVIHSAQETYHSFSIFHLSRNTPLCIVNRRRWVLETWKDAISFIAKIILCPPQYLSLLYLHRLWLWAYSFLKTIGKCKNLKKIVLYGLSILCSNAYIKNICSHM
jgi:hypothetical protein